MCGVACVYIDVYMWHPTRLSAFCWCVCPLLVLLWLLLMMSLVDEISREEEREDDGALFCGGGGTADISSSCEENDTQSHRPDTGDDDIYTREFLLVCKHRAAATSSRNIGVVCTHILCETYACVGER